MDLADRFKVADPNLALAHCLAALDEGSGPPTERLIFPAGEFKTTKGIFLFDSAAADAVMADWQEWTGGLSQKGSSDYEHDQTKELMPGHLKLDSSKYDLELRKGALWAVNIVWTDLAAEIIIARAKRFTSPWWLYEKATRRIVRYINFGLVSLPATIAQPELVAAAASVQVPASIAACFAGYTIIEEAAGIVPHHKYPLDESASWDADAATKRFREYADGDMKKFALGFAYFNGSGDKEGDYVLPHHDIKDGKIVTVWGGVKAAATRLEQADIPDKDLPAVRKHLTEHYHEFGKTAPWEKKQGKRASAEPDPDDDSAPAEPSASTTAAQAASTETSAMAKDPKFVPTRHSYALRYMASTAMENMMCAIQLNGEVPLVCAAMGLDKHCASMAEHVSKCAGTMAEYMQGADDGMDDAAPDEASLVASIEKLPAELKTVVEKAFADCKAAKLGGLLQRAHQAALASVSATRFEKSAVDALRSTKDLVASVFDLTKQSTPAAAQVALAALARNAAGNEDQTAAALLAAEKAKKDAETAAETARIEAEAADKKEYDRLIDANRNKVTKGADETWVRANIKAAPGIKASEALAVYLEARRPVSIASTHEQAAAGGGTQANAQQLAAQTEQQREAIIETTEPDAKELAGWAQTGGGDARLRVLKENQAKKLGLIL